MVLWLNEWFSIKILIFLASVGILNNWFSHKKMNQSNKLTLVFSQYLQKNIHSKNTRQWFCLKKVT